MGGVRPLYKIKTIHLLSYPPVFHDDFMPFIYGGQGMILQAIVLTKSTGKMHVLGARPPDIIREIAKGIIYYIFIIHTCIYTHTYTYNINPRL